MNDLAKYSMATLWNMRRGQLGALRRAKSEAGKARAQERAMEIQCELERRSGMADES